MTDYRSIEERLRETFNLRRRPVAVTFRAAPPAGVAKLTGTEPSGCSFWRVAAGGRTFYTVPSDHYNCAVGSHAHRMGLPPDRAQELDQTLGFMTASDTSGRRRFPASHACPKRRAPWSTLPSATRRSTPMWCGWRDGPPH